MSSVTDPARLLFLDLRRHPLTPLPEPAGTVLLRPGTETAETGGAALLALIAIDSEAAYADWQSRFQSLCPSGFPHVFLLDPYAPDLARRVLQDGAADCCGFDDAERLALIVARLQVRQATRGRQAAIDSEPVLALRLQNTLDTLPNPIFIKDRHGRYIACNRAFEAYLGLPRATIVGATVFDISPPDLAAIYHQADLALMQAGGTQSYESNVRYADGTLHDVIFHKAVFRDADGAVDGIAGSMLDITERKSLERQLALAASTDFLTGIYNLRTFYELGEKEFRRARRSHQPLSLLTIDLDRFKEINDALGHATGDDALRQFTAAVQENLREQDIFARTGGDEFHVVLPETSPDGAYHVAERIRQAVGKRFVGDAERQQPLSISVGLTGSQDSDHTLEDMVLRADAALYAAKGNGRNCIFPRL